MNTAKNNVGGDKSLVGGESSEEGRGEFFQVGGMSKFSASGSLNFQSESSPSKPD